MEGESAGVEGKPTDKESVLEVVCMGDELSTMVTVAVKEPDTVGIPLRTPDELKLNPAGSPVALQVYGAVPPWP